MKNSKTLSDLIKALQEAVHGNKLTGQVVEDATKTLTVLGHKEYDFEKFPVLTTTSSFKGSVGDTPDSLAEALLWKLGKWEVYKTYVENFNNKELKVSSKGGVVFSAFAKHLQDKNNNPIYDQHAIRALWAISVFSNDEKEKCKSLLFDGSSHWKHAGSGDDGSCYALFVRHMKSLCEVNNVSSEKLDRLLMPLGQAIKKDTRIKKGTKSSDTDHDRFSDLCWPGDG